MLSPEHFGRTTNASGERPCALDTTRRACQNGGSDHLGTTGGQRSAGLEQRRSGREDVVHQQHPLPHHSAARLEPASTVRAASFRCEPGLIVRRSPCDEGLLRAQSGPLQEQCDRHVTARPERRPGRRHRHEMDGTRWCGTDASGSRAASRTARGSRSASRSILLRTRETQRGGDGGAQRRSEVRRGIRPAAVFEGGERGAHDAAVVVCERDTQPVQLDESHPGPKPSATVVADGAVGLTAPGARCRDDDRQSVEERLAAGRQRGAGPRRRHAGSDGDAASGFAHSTRLPARARRERRTGRSVKNGPDRRTWGRRVAQGTPGHKSSDTPTASPNSAPATTTPASADSGTVILQGRKPTGTTTSRGAEVGVEGVSDDVAGVAVVAFGALSERLVEVDRESYLSLG